MHNHNNHNQNGGHKGMLWMMIPCLLLLGLLFFGWEKLSSSWYLWLILIGVCVVPHIWMMWKGHGGHSDTDKNSKADASEQLETKDKSKHGCCH